jgi:hypothetical protein
MAKDTEINIKSTGLKDLRNELKDIKSQIADISSQDIITQEDIANMEKLSMKAGELKDRFDDINERVSVFAGGSEFEKVSNGLGLIGTQLGNLDFQGAAESAKLLTSTIKGLNPATISAGLKGLATTVTQLGKAFFEMGLKILLNPLFLIPALIAGVVIAVVLLKDKVKILGQIFDAVAAPIKALIQALKDLTDWLGLTTFAEDKLAEATKEAADAAEISAERRYKAIQKYNQDIQDEYTYQINLLKAQGKDTRALEIAQQEQRVKDADENAKELTEAYSNAFNERFDLEEKLNEKLTKEGLTLAERKAKITLDADVKAARDKEAKASDAADAELKISKDSSNKILELRAKFNKEDLDKSKKAAQDRIKLAQEISDIILAINRRAEEIRIDSLDEGFEKENEKIRNNLKNQISELDKQYIQLKAKRGSLTDDEVEQYNLSRARLQVIADAAYNKLVNTEIENLKELRKAKALERKKEIEDLENFQKEQSQKVITVLANARNLVFKSDDEARKERRSQIISQYDQARNDLKTALFNELSTFEGNEIEKTKIKRKYAKIREELDKSEQKALKDTTEVFGEETKKVIGQVTAIADAFSSLLGGINDLQKQNADQKVKALEANLKVQSDLLEAQRQQELSRTGLSEEAKAGINRKFDQLKYQQELVAFNKGEEIKKKAFEKDKKYRIASAAMATASAAVNALGSLPFPANIVVAGLMAALGAVQIATISKQKYDGGTPPTAPSAARGASIGSDSDSAAPNFQLFGNANRGSEASAAQSVNRRVNDDTNITVIARFSETEVTDSQNRVDRYKRGAEL